MRSAESSIPAGDVAGAGGHSQPCPEKQLLALRVVILQDHAELKPSKKAISSIPVLESILENIDVKICDAKTYAAAWDLSSYSDPAAVALLYPSDASSVLSVDSNSNQKSHIEESPSFNEDDSTSADMPFIANQLKCLVVLDGSWVTVQHILARNAFLHPSRCRHIRLPPYHLICTSIYHTSGLRREPVKGFVSTAEAVAWALFFIDKEYQSVSLNILQSFQSFVESKAEIEISTHFGLITNSFHESEKECGEYNLAEDVVLPIGDASLLPSRGIKCKRPISKAEKRKIIRSKERKRKR